MGNKSVVLDLSRINFIEAKQKLQGAVAAVIPAEEDRQPDLLYFSAVLVSEGANLNRDYFDKEYLLAARHTPIHKYVSWEHSSARGGTPRNTEIIGSIISSVVTSQKDGSVIPEDEITENDDGSLSVPEKYGDIDLTIGGVIWKLEYQKEAKLIAGATKDNELGISMECLFPSWSFLCGGKRHKRDDDEGKKMADLWESRSDVDGEPVYRVLENFFFSGSAMTWNRANPRSNIKAAAKKLEMECESAMEGELKNVEPEKENIKPTSEKEEVKPVEKDEMKQVVAEFNEALKSALEVKDSVARSEEFGKVSQKLEAITDELTKTKEALATVSTERDELKAKSDETEKKLSKLEEDVAKDKALAKRMKELAEAGVILEGEKGEGQSQRVREMTDEVFASYKQDLIDIKGTVETEKPKVEEAKADEAEGKEDKKKEKKEEEEVKKDKEEEEEVPEADVESAQASVNKLRTKDSAKTDLRSIYSAMGQPAMDKEIEKAKARKQVLR